MSGFMKTVLKKSSGFFIIHTFIYLFIYLFLAFRTAAACKSYVA